MRKFHNGGKFTAIAVPCLSIVAFFSIAILSIFGATVKNSMILLWNASSEPYASITQNGSLKLGDRVFSSRTEGQGTGPKSFSIVKDTTSSGGKVLHYLVLSQLHDGHKARAEHYLHIEPMTAAFFSEFSIKLDPEFTIVDAIRPDAGPNWCILRQWHQGIAIPPPLSLGVEKGTNNVVSWGIITSSDPVGHHSTSQSFGQKKLELGRWYHFRIRWNISPDEHGQVIVMMSDTTLPKDLTAANILFRYDGPVGYKVKDWNHPGIAEDGDEHAPNTVRQHRASTKARIPTQCLTTDYPSITWPTIEPRTGEHEAGISSQMLQILWASSRCLTSARGFGVFSRE